MPKQKFSTADVAAEVACLREKVLGMRLTNIYDLDSKTYMLKLSRSAGQTDDDTGEKIFVILESGSRFHTTQILPEKNDTPSNFTLKLRKHLRSKRLDDIRHLGVDRICVFTFGSGPAAHHLILEMYAGGNLILTDNQYGEQMSCSIGISNEFEIKSPTTRSLSAQQLHLTRCLAISLL